MSSPAAPHLDVSSHQVRTGSVPDHRAAVYPLRPFDMTLHDEAHLGGTPNPPSAGVTVPASLRGSDADIAVGPDSLSGRRVGPYRVLREIGTGGMGSVYLGVRDDDVFHKQVAIKIVKRGMDTDLVLNRFRHERRILAALDHPYIAHVIDGGSTDDGRPYLVMEYVRGVPITSYCERANLNIHARLRLFRKVCEAVQHAHRHLILHRDLKPSNILVDESGEPRLLDFGVAKLLAPSEEFTTLTGGTGAPLTPRYASPEQLRGESVTTAADVYALGAVLYEMLTGVPAHPDVAGTPAQIARSITDHEIRRPSTVARAAARGLPASDLTGDVDTIVLMAMRPEWRERYVSVEQMSEDVRRYLENLPILARPLTLRFASPNRSVAIVARWRQRRWSSRRW